MGQLLEGDMRLREFFFKMGKLCYIYMLLDDARRGRNALYKRKVISFQMQNL